MVFLTFFSFILSWCCGVWIVRSCHGHAFRYGLDKPQRFHAGAVPRLGGLALMFGAVVSWFLRHWLTLRS